MHTGDYLISQNLKCPYCGAQYKGVAGLLQHIKFKHKKSSKSIYDDFCKKPNDGICVVCGKPTEYKKGGYLKTCSVECKKRLNTLNVDRNKKISKKRKKYNNETYIEKAKSIHGNKFDYSQTQYKEYNSDIIVICKKHGKFTTKASYHLQNKCGGCRKCANDCISETKIRWPEYKKNETVEKMRSTNLKRYGNKNGPQPFGSEKYKKLILKKYGVENPFQSEEIKEKIKETNRKKYAVDNVGETDFVIKKSHSKAANQKRYLTHKQNNSFNKSQPEEDFYQFLLRFCDKKNVFRNYRDEKRYPFACDFYLKEYDVFIELNLYFTHGFHWFDNSNPKDVEKLKIWEEKSNEKKLYKQAIKVWTKYDPLKRECAKKHKLKYLVFWNVKEIENFETEIGRKEDLFKRINNIIESNRGY